MKKTRTDELISVIVPIYKVEKYLKKCIESILCQTYTNIELILVDDGSPDKCPQLCDEFAKEDSRIVVIHQKNGGLSAARNTGIKIATGDYIGFVDSDDYIHPQMFEKLMEAIQTTDSDVAICSYFDVDEYGNRMNKISPVKDEVLDSNAALDKLEQTSWWYYVTAWNKLYKRELFENVAFPVGKQNEDVAVVHLIFFEAKRIVTISEALYYYLHRKESIMRSASVNSFNDVEMLYGRILFYENHGMYYRLEPTAHILLEQYWRHRLSIKANSKENKKYITKIDKIARGTYKKYYAGKDIINNFKYQFPWTCVISSRIKHCLNKLRRLTACIIKSIKINRKKIILVDTPTHGNLGDHAIVLAEKQFVESRVGMNKITEVTASEYDEYGKWLAKLTPMNQIILVPGGGFLGALWPDEEYRFRDILERFPQNRIIVFPQTVTFDLSSEGGKRFFEESKERYEAHPNLTIFVREKKSYNFLREHMPRIDCYMVPDIVTELRANINVGTRSGILLCMRSDVEKSLSEEDVCYIEECVKKTLEGEPIRFTDTVVSYSVQPQDRSVEVTKKLEQFASSRLIITDRLHGMIFAALAGTPCIAFGNSNGKVRMVYEWMKELPYIQYVEKLENFAYVLKKININKTYMYDYRLFDNKFQQLEKKLKEELL